MMTFGYRLIISSFSIKQMKNLNEINSKIKTMLDAWSKDPSHYEGNTVTKWIIFSTLTDSCECQDVSTVVLDGSATIEDVLKAAGEIKLCGTPDCTMFTEIVQYVSVYSLDDNKYLEKASSRWTFDEFKEFANDKICRADKFLFGKEGWWDEYVVSVA